MVRTGAGDGNTANSGSKGGRTEGLKDLTAWIDGDELEIVMMSGGKNDTGDMCSFSERTSGPIAVERSTREGGDVRLSETLIGDHKRAIEQEEEQGGADRDNVTGEECMKLDLEREKMRAQKR